jgi:hypothetical protein
MARRATRAPVVNRHRKNDRLAKALEGTVPEIHVIGDSMNDELGYVANATHSAAEVALRI